MSGASTNGTMRTRRGGDLARQGGAAATPTRDRPCDGRHLLALLDAASTWLDAHRASVDALNVFPVPDGDTGTNMSMTLTAALREARSSPAHEAGVIAERAAYGALMGARGNSGVILSQLLRGFARALQGHHTIGPEELVAALTMAADTAGRAVMKPVDGTILTVSVAAAKAAAQAQAHGADLVAILDAALDEAWAAVARTPDQLPILKQAGVVDSGAQGYALILEGAARHAHGLPVSAVSASSGTAAGAPQMTAHVAHLDDYGYCTEFVVAGPHLDPNGLRDAIGTLGDSTLVVGEEGLVRVHIHTDDPGRVLSAVTPLGRLHKVKIESMQDQHDRFVAEHGAEGAGAVPEATGTTPIGRAQADAGASQVGLTGVVAVAPGEGLAEVYRSLGVGAVVAGGQTMNPSTEELLRAIDALPQEHVLILPNNGNVLLVAGQARDLAHKTVTVVPARTVPQGIAAMVAYLPGATPDENIAAMMEAIENVRTGEVTVAVRDAQLDGLTVQAGQVLGLLDDHAEIVGTDRDEVALELIERMGAEDADVLTVYYGQELGESDAARLAERARSRYAGLEIETVNGGQPYYPYIMSIE